MPIKISTSDTIFRWRPAAWLRVAGADAHTFLQGQFSNDLTLLRSRPAVYGLWLTLKGKVEADSFILKRESADEYWIGSYYSPAAQIRQRLEGYIIADDVTIEDETAQWNAVTVLGPAAEQVLQHGAGTKARVFPGRREHALHAECVFPNNADQPDWLQEPGLGTTTAEEMTRRRIRAGIAAVPIDCGPHDLPNEAGLETEAVSYSKGCYLGQEVMARLKSMGQVRRKLLRVRGEPGPLPPLPCPVFAAARRVGELRSAVADGAGVIGLAMLSLMQVTPETPLAFEPEGAPRLRLEGALP